MKYTIVCDHNTANGIIKQFLGKDQVWYSATNNAASFPSLQAARQWFKTANKYDLRGSSIWIEGPRGGRHSHMERS